MYFCLFKILYYGVLIIYQGSDIYFDIHQYCDVAVYNGTFSGFHVDNSSLPYQKILLLTCITGGLSSVAMMGLYCYYIYHHLECMCGSDYLPVAYRADHEGEGMVSLLGDPKCRRRSPTCNRRVIWFELVFELFELCIKDDLQSFLSFYVFHVDGVSKRPCWQSIAFSVYSIVAHLKHIVCFVTKLCGLGDGESGVGDCENIKGWSCVIGCFGSAVFEVLTVWSLVDALS